MMMLDIEEIMCELEGGGGGDQAAGGGGGGGSLMPPGFRFHPTDEELITYYLASKVFINDTCSLSASVDIPQVDLNRCEPWELPDVAKMGEREWYFYSMRDRKYPTGLRTNRATGAGYWKATGKDKEVYSSSGSRFGGSGSKGLLGMKKTLVFYKGRAPRGEKTKWVMHEYRLDGDFSCRHTCKDEWVICRIFHKMGEKKHGGIIMNNATNIHGGQSLYHHHHQLQEEQHPPPPSSSPSPTVPLLESTTTPSLSSLLLESHNPATTTLPPPLMMQQHIQNPNFLFQHHPENDLIKSFPTSPSLFPTIVTGCCFQTNDPSPNSNTTNFIINTIPTTTDNKSNTETNASPSPSSLLRSLLSNQDYFTTTIPQQCKTEAIFSQIDHHPLSHGHHLSRLGHYWGGLDKTNPTDHQITCSSSSSCCQNPIPNFGVDFSVNATVLGFSSSSLAAEGAGTKLAAGGTTTTTSSVAFKKSGFHQMLLDMM